MQYQNLVIDFANRTKKNLEFIEQHEGQPEFEIYEVTQLINSLLGLLVFPRERNIDVIPYTALTDLANMGWPRVEILQGTPPCTDLNTLVRYLRNSIAHFNLEFTLNAKQEINGIKIWNCLHGRKNWEALLSLDDLKRTVDQFITLVNEIDYQENPNGRHQTLQNL